MNKLNRVQHRPASNQNLFTHFTGQYSKLATNDSSTIQQQLLPNSNQELATHLAQQQQPQFNYNPIYTSLQQFGSTTVVHGLNDKNSLEGQNQPVRNQEEELLAGNTEEDDVLSDIYHYSDQTGDSCNQKQQHQHQCTFDHPQQHLKRSKQLDGSNGSANGQQLVTCPRVLQQQQSFSTDNFEHRQRKKLSSETVLMNDQQVLAVRGKRSQPVVLAGGAIGGATVANFQPIFQQQLGNFSTQMTTSHHNVAPMELAEECNGLFVEYQTNRNSLGALEELHSLNVTNCDSDTLEEHINMLSAGEDCFPGNDDLQEFNIETSNDQFLNMLCLNNQQANTRFSNHSESLSAISIQQQHQQQHLHSNDGSSHQQNQSQIHNQEQQVQQSNLFPITTIQDQHKKLIKAPTGSTRVSNSASQTKCNTTTKRSQSVRKVKEANYQDASPTSNQQQQKITTTNTNRRLLLKKNSCLQSSGVSMAQQQQPHQQPINQCKKKTIADCRKSSGSSSSSTSSSSVSSGALSPSSSSTQFDYSDAPYRQQLENLRKKLKMDVAPVVQEQQHTTSCVSVDRVPHLLRDPQIQVLPNRTQQFHQNPSTRLTLISGQPELHGYLLIENN